MVHPLIERFQLLRNVGQFDSVVPTQITFEKLSLIYAENGRGKTTLATILRSASNGDAGLITERQRLGSQHLPHVVFADQSGPIVFENGAWSRTLSNLVVFDDKFVADNVCSGIEIDAAHRKNLHELILGAQGVSLYEALQMHVLAIEIHNRNTRALADAIPLHARGTLDAETFCNLKAHANIDAAIQDAERSLAAAKAASAVLTSAIFTPFALPGFDVAGIEAILQRDLPALEASAAARVQAHMARLGKDGEGWVADGVPRIASASVGNEGEVCPFCIQDLRGSPLIAHYQAYFSAAYAELKSATTLVGKAVISAHADDVPTAFERSIHTADQAKTFWSTFTTVPNFRLDTVEIALAWKTAREGVLTALRAKYSSPLERMALPVEVSTAIEKYNRHRDAVEAASASLQRINDAIMLVKEQTASSNVVALEADLARLLPIKARYTPTIDAACEAYLAEKAAKAVTEMKRTEARAALDHYRTNIFPAYETAINRYLQRFGAAFRLDSVKFASIRGGSSCTFNVLINEVAVSTNAANGPSFRNTLSAGDRNALALAFFFATLENDAAIAKKIVVIDDPMTSLDEHRNRNTLNEMKRLLGRVDQMIVLSHSKPFLCPLWQGTTTSDRVAIRIDRVRNGQNQDASTLTPWNVHADCVSEHDHRHELVSGYLQNAAGANERAVAEALRPILEAFVRVAYPGTFPPGTLLGKFITKCEQRKSSVTSIMSIADTVELREIVEYANEFHHDTNPAYKTVLINGTELTEWAERTLAFARRS